MRRLGLERSVISPLLAVTVNIAILFILYTLLRVEYLLENWTYFREAVHEGRLWSLLGAGAVFDAPGIFYLNILYIAMLLFPFHLKERDGYYAVCKWVFITVNSLGILANLIDSVYFSYTLRRTTFDLFAEFAGDDNIAKIIGVEMTRHWYLVIVCIVLIWGLWKVYVTPSSKINLHPLWRYYLWSVLSLAVGVLTAVSAIRGGLLVNWWHYLIGAIFLYAAWRVWRTGQWRRRGIYATVLTCAGGVLIVTAPLKGWRHRDIRPIAISNANKYIKRPNEAALILNTPFSLIRTIGSVPFKDPEFMPDAEMETLYTPVHQAVMLPDSVASKGKNVVVMILESFGREYIGQLNHDILGEDYKGFAPFIASLAQVSATWRWTFDNGQKSIEGMPSVLAGIPSFVKPFVLTSASMNRLKGLPAILGEEGYATAFFHGARKGSMGFDGFARSVGFQDYFGREAFLEDGRAGGEEEFDGYWGIWDEPFLQYFALKMSDLQQPLMTSRFTLSSHHPFDLPDKDKGKFPEGTEP
ncbi:MAG: sulfatase-like hydrolase/transferase, partial [Muribaculaceae bacterium]|nr:sulfatase-like hydrolase/transferase [Muribaculaceae bacterium]